MIQKVGERIIRSIGEKIFSKRKDKIIFAVSVHSTECWLLPIYFQDDKKSKLANCLGTLNQGLNKKLHFTIDRQNKNPRYYEIAFKFYLKHKNFRKLYKKNPSLKVFIEKKLIKKA